MKIPFGRFGAALCVGALASLTPLSATPAVAHGALIPAIRGQVLPTRNADVTSLNWSGYAVTGSNITAVTQNWTVPSVSIAPPGFSSTWAGIGGYNTADLIQAGTESDTVGAPFAWYEILPASETPLTSCTGDSNCTVQPGDAMSVTITSVGGGNWTISMTNPRWTWSKTINYPQSTFSSAEWILEAPTVAVQTIIANVGTQQFTAGSPGNTYTQGGTTNPIGAGNPVRILLSPTFGLVNEATPSSLNPAGTAFNSCAYQQSCAAPA